MITKEIFNKWQNRNQLILPRIVEVAQLMSDIWKDIDHWSVGFNEEEMQWSVGRIIIGGPNACEDHDNIYVNWTYGYDSYGSVKFPIEYLWVDDKTITIEQGMFVADYINERIRIAKTRKLEEAKKLEDRGRILRGELSSCCKNEQRNMNGGCDNCGDPSF